MNRNVAKSLLFGAVLLAGIVITQDAAKATGVVDTAKTNKAEVTQQNVGGFWVRATSWPSRYGSLSSIAGSVYGNPGLWNKIFQANRKTISNPNFIRVGQRIYVPRLGNTHNNTTKASRSGSRTPQAAWTHPLPGVRVSSCYGWRWGSMHRGIDYDGNFGDRIRSVGSGRVVKVGWWAGGYGISVLVYHGGNFYSHYGHMQRSAVHVNQHVRPGSILGYVGATGDATGSHLHFEIWRGNWNQIDPRGWMRNHGLRPGC